ncbi:hypothetical protein ANN_21236 [Periplaneta americana]|uniref:Uncharacterized protein n=1 Tax=Periplaneta americana TaxID=6978 RepID=A0ABQ8SES4_PERAM|nr:hypothetical protein ANN_21236 [Periplaneta americana]
MQVVDSRSFCPVKGGSPINTKLRYNDTWVMRRFGITDITVIRLCSLFKGTILRKRLQLHPYLLQLLQALIPEDKVLRRNFCTNNGTDHTVPVMCFVCNVLDLVEVEAHFVNMLKSITANAIFTATPMADRVIQILNESSCAPLFIIPNGTSTFQSHLHHVHRKTSTPTRYAKAPRSFTSVHIAGSASETILTIDTDRPFS